MQQKWLIFLWYTFGTFFAKLIGKYNDCSKLKVKTSLRDTLYTKSLLFQTTFVISDKFQDIIPQQRLNGIE